MEAPVVDGSIYLIGGLSGGGESAPDFDATTITGQEGLDLVGEIQPGN